jgi:hypothetical protein
MLARSSLRWAPLVALLLAACADGGPLAGDEGLDPAEDGPLTAVLPDLAPEPGTAGTERYVPTLERILNRAVPVIREKQGEEAAQRVVAEARRLHADLRAAREGGDEAAVKEALRKLEGFCARVGLRVFGPQLIRRVHGDAAGKLEALRVRLKAAGEAGQDVSRQVAGAQQARRLLAASREAAERGEHVPALVHAAHALDLVIRIHASF